VSAPSQRAALRTAAFEYQLPEDRIAQEPLQRRDASRLLLVGANGELTDHRFAEVPSLLRPGDLCVVNDTRVRAARLRGRRSDDGVAELLVVRKETPSDYTCLVRPARRIAAGERVRVGDELDAVVVGPAPGHAGARLVRFSARDGNVDAAIERTGEAPLPPYIHAHLADATRYQTVYATGAGESAAAPTAGLHFTAGVMEQLRERGVDWAVVRLEVGLSTFAPMRSDDIAEHEMHEERYLLPEEAAHAITAARRRGGRVIAIGTTVVRVLESCVDADGRVHPGAGATRLFVTPGHRFRAIDGLLTNFHQPRSTLLVLLAAFTGAQRWRVAYEHALRSGYRFLSFGDCMLCWAPEDS
jgi:S-adenosylmethionine:tRNA ribosyltransferase-isomerase